ncbi:hypothetical protein [Bosea sp. 124]|uniref:hypothetical protein n=1 Tax=Bosea sp. 124 TaxID=2135642 RepID=UPI000D3C3D12|nr:hypothetical protein [Bosea sp. 124]PTM39551.1 hypothetical protein C8D03_1053 [Bosea sp. 124]
MSNTQDWLTRAAASDGSSTQILAIALEITKSPQASTAQVAAAKRVANSVRTVLRQRAPSGVAVEVSQIRFAALLEALRSG